jgi:nucleoside 2-deoxyribosyltransferase
MAKIYVASSWRNTRQPRVVEILRNNGHSVYDFRNPAPGQSGFAWSEIDPNWQKWTAEEYRAALRSEIAEKGYAHDMGAMQWADTCVLVLPCGRSAHLELGWMAGAGKRTVILTQDGEEPELMAKMATRICTGMNEVLSFLGEPA